MRYEAMVDFGGGGSSSQDEVLLSVRGLRTELATPRGRFHAVDGVSFSIRRGEAVAIVGESGCGKSMTARSILRVMPRAADRISADELHFRGRDLAAASDAEMRKTRGARISMIFQDPMSHLDPSMRVGDQIAEVLAAHQALRGKALVAAVSEALAAAQVPDVERVARAYPHQLSGGLRQRALIAMALACGPELLIADEPTTALDVTTQRQILKLLRQLVRERSMGLMLITHDLGVVASVCDRVYVMYAGQIVEQAPVEDFFRAPQHPYSQGLLSSVKSLGHPRDRFTSIPGRVPDLLSPPAGCRFQERCPLAMKVCEVADPVARLPLQLSADAACWRVHPEAAPHV